MGYFLFKAVHAGRDSTVVDAILDRIVHSAHQIVLSGESLCMMKARKANK